MPKSTIPEKWLNRTDNYHTSRFVVEPTRPFGDGLAKHIIISSIQSEELRGSPSLVGRGIANPMSERTRGFETLPSLPSFDVP